LYKGITVAIFRKLGIFDDWKMSVNNEAKGARNTMRHHLKIFKGMRPGTIDAFGLIASMAFLTSFVVTMLLMSGDG